MPYKPRPKCRKCRGTCESIYAKRWKLRAAKWTIIIIGLRCLKNNHVLLYPNDPDYATEKPKRNAK